MGRGRFLQLLGMSLSPCCPYHPAGVTCRLGQSAACHAAFAPTIEGSASGVHFCRGHLLGSLSLRPGDSLTIPRMALSVGFIRFVSSTDATQATGFLTFAPVGLTPTEHASLRWTHCVVKIQLAFETNNMGSPAFAFPRRRYVMLQG